MPEHFYQIAEPWLAHYGYPALFGVMFLEGVGIPAPGLTFLLVAVLLGSRGEMLITAVAGAALAGYASGCQLAFRIGRKGGRRLLLRTGLLNRPRLHKLRRLFGRWGAPLLVAAPFLDGTRQYASLFAGTADTDWLRFSLLNLTGAALWIGVWCTAADLFGHDIEPLFGLLHRSALWMIGAVVTAAIAWLVYRIARRAFGNVRKRR